jgi:uncharacterized protein (DUF1501 family)
MALLALHLAGLGTRILYTTAPANSFDTHATEMAKHPQLWHDVSHAVSALYQDLKEHNASANVVLFLFTEFGRRVAENASLGADHGTGGLAYLIGGGVNGGQVIGSWPGLAPADLEMGEDVRITTDLRTVLAEFLSKRLVGTNLATVFPGFAGPYSANAFQS